MKFPYTYRLPLSTLRAIRPILPAPGFLQRPRRPGPSFSALGILHAER